MIAVKNWFIEKNQIESIRNKELTVKRETEKAILVSWKVKKHSSWGDENYTFEQWIPKSCLTDKWEKDTSNFGYHDYLVEVVNQAYRDGRLENKTFTSGRNIYDQTSFTHQSTTKELVNFLQKKNIEFMNRKEWNER